jgi:hypothetical protein
MKDADLVVVNFPPSREGVAYHPDDLVAGVTREANMKEVDTIFETGIGQLFDGSFAFRVKGERVAEFYQMQGGPKAELQDGWLICGPFKTEKAAARNLRDFARDYLAWAYPNLEVSEAPDPQSLN